MLLLRVHVRTLPPDKRETSHGGLRSFASAREATIDFAVHVTMHELACTSSPSTHRTPNPS
jgi:hypothetical protein